MKTTFTAPTTTTFATAKTGATIRCTKGRVHPTAKVPSPGHGTAIFADGERSSASLQLTRHRDGSLVVSCAG